MLYPLTFAPIFKPRIWGSEIWAVSDRPGDESVVTNGPLAGRTLRAVMDEHRNELLGDALPAVSGRFPLLCKVIDARETLSVQVHPPAARAPALGGEPKTEMWYVAGAEPGAELHVGLKRGVTRELFEARLHAGTVADCLHRVPVSPGDAMFLPSGRVHAIGGGLRLFEIQQNSDTTYRVFDWNRLGLDGRARELHIRESLASIDFNDIEPALVERARAWCHVVVASVFVNPAQFNDPTDLARYPRDEAGDLALLAHAGADVVYLPTPEVVYPPGFATWVDVDGLTTVLEGAHRPGHFRGVATVVTHLLRAARPDVAFFGEKDWQQLQVIRRLVTDLWLDVRIAPVPTVRDHDGLALSSRNARLDVAARHAARASPAALEAAQQAFAAGERSVDALERRLRETLDGTPGIGVDYACVVHPETLSPIARADASSRALIAAQVGGVRLIDNAALGAVRSEDRSAG